MRDGSDARQVRIIRGIGLIAPPTYCGVTVVIC
jgi:hypothetical protein